MAMGKIRLAASFLVAAGIIIAGPVEAAGGRAAKRGARPSTTAAKPVSSSQVLIGHLFLNRYQAGENLAAACRRANFKNLAIALKMNSRVISTPKQEFETSEQYAERAGKIAAIVSDEAIIICEPLDDNPDVPFTYQADLQRFEGSFAKSHNVWRDVKQLGTYRSRTRMGIPMTIRASVEMEFNIALNLASGLKGCLAGDYSSFNFRVPSPLSSAPALKAGGRIVFLAKLEAPYVSKSEDPGRPALDNPYDIYTHTLTVSAKPEKLVVIDAAGKEVWSCVVGTAGLLQSHLSAKNNDDAVRALNAALARVASNPRDGGALADAGNAALATNDVDAAIGFYTRANQVAPGNPQAKAGLAGGYVRNEDPYTAIGLFNEAEQAGPIPSVLLADRGLAYDLVGDNATAQRYYRQAGSTNDEALRRLALSLAIIGDKLGSEAALSPLIVRQDKSAWRTRAFSLAILGDETQAVQIANATMSTASSSGVAPYLRYMRQLTHAQQAAAANLGHFPRASEIGRDDPRIAQYLSGDVLRPADNSARLQVGNADIAAPLRAAQATNRTPVDPGDVQFRQLFNGW